MGFPVLSCHSRLLDSACIGHFLQAEEPRDLCTFLLLDDHLTLAVCQPSAQGTQPGPSAILVPGMQPPPSWLPL